jgi:excisionase family DNA binding protein
MDLTKAKWITVDEMKNRLSISRNKAYEIANSGSLETVKIGRSLRINEESLDHWLDSLSFPKADGGGDMR